MFMMDDKIRLTTEFEPGCCVCAPPLLTDYLVKYAQERGEGIYYPIAGSQLLPLLLLLRLPRMELTDEVWGLSSDAVELIQI